MPDAVSFNSRLDQPFRDRFDRFFRGCKHPNDLVCGPMLPIVLGLWMRSDGWLVLICRWSGKIPILHIHEMFLALMKIALLESYSHWKDSIARKLIAFHPFISCRNISFFVDGVSRRHIDSLYCSDGKKKGSKRETHSFWYSGLLLRETRLPEKEWL